MCTPLNVIDVVIKKKIYHIDGTIIILVTEPKCTVSKSDIHLNELIHVCV